MPQARFAVVAGLLAATLAGCGAKPSGDAARAPLVDPSHTHHHLHASDVEHDHEHADFDAGAHSHGHDHAADKPSGQAE